MMLLVLAVSPWLTAIKCFDRDPFYAPSVIDSGTGTSTTADASVDFVPARPCAEREDGAHAAEIRISNRAYVIGCGCEEASGSTCTIPAGTVVTWRFVDSEEHDVSSVGGVFGESGDRLAGTWSVTFPTAGEFPYLCNIHSADMSGYTIVVR
jgi:plastocyanin